jgi:transmembrane sensor
MSIMNNLQYNSVENFVFDQSFRNWVLNKADKDETAFWEEWTAQNAHKLEMLNISKNIIHALSVKRQQLGPTELDREIEKIILQLPLVETTTADVPVLNIHQYPKKNLYKKWISIAASIVLLLSAGYYFYWQSQKSRTAPYDNFYAANEKSLIEFSNNTSNPQQFNLPDGSTALLESRSRLSYSLNKDEAGNFLKREIFLEGGCFFNVQKNPLQPFIVYTNSIVTKVLGTSFRVSAYSKDEKATIEVRTGKVSVYRKEDFKKEASRPNELGGLLLLPNQQVIFSSGNSRLVKSLITNPVILSRTSEQKTALDEVPVKELFQKLEIDYGIKIIYDEASISNCAITATTFGDQSFYQKLNLICKSINGRYESIDGSIVIFSSGCK